MSRDLWFEDFAAGQVYQTAGATLTESQILDFAMQWDPQRFHLDAEAAAESPYGGLIASGFQSLLVSFRLFLEEGLIRKCSLGSPGIDELRWIAPVRPGDTLRARIEILETKPSRSKPDRGVGVFAVSVSNQTGAEVMTWRCAILLARRPTNAEDGSAS
jgi:acyl dehydratase